MIGKHKKPIILAFWTFSLFILESSFELILMGHIDFFPIFHYNVFSK